MSSRHIHDGFRLVNAVPVSVLQPSEQNPEKSPTQTGIRVALLRRESKRRIRGRGRIGFSEKNRLREPKNRVNIDPIRLRLAFKRPFEWVPLGVGAGQRPSLEAHFMSLQSHLNNRKSRGFTLIELLIVIAIILILIAIALPNFLEAQIRARVTRAKAEIRTLAISMEAYFLDWKYYPSFSFPNYTVQFDRRVRGLTWLTSSIAYITSLPEDPFPGDQTPQGDELFGPPLFLQLGWSRVTPTRFGSPASRRGVS